MEIVFEKIPLEEYLTFFDTTNDSSIRHWLVIQHEFLLPPSWTAFNTYEIYCPENMCLVDNREFIIPTGFKCASEFKQALCLPCFETINDINLSKNELQKHIVVKGTAKGNRCFQNGDRLIKIKFIA